MARSFSRAGCLGLRTYHALSSETFWPAICLGPCCLFQSRPSPAIAFSNSLAGSWQCRPNLRYACNSPAYCQSRDYSDHSDRDIFEWIGGLPSPASPDLLPSLDTDHRSPTDVIWPASRHQQRVASRVQTALSLAFMDSARRDLFMNKLGLCILQVRMSPDHMTAYVLWEAHEAEIETTRRALSRSIRDIRGAMARHLHAKRVPRLEFRFNTLTDAQEEVETEMERLELERQLEQLQSGS
ncbi:hypothetical protein WJX84_003398 [Apatococcus fuscideae]|uniref:Ribosome-binding factor A n=1 Tax=Apatococcus fuscideae TaxID=2026836 RepID=A0AAW1SPV9_9CHLO